MKKRAVFVIATLLLGLIGVSWYMGLQLHNAQVAQAVSFADYYQVLRDHIAKGTELLEEHLKEPTGYNLLLASQQWATAAKVSLPLEAMAPKAASDPWEEFLRADWLAIAASAEKLAEREQYFGIGNLPAEDLAYLESLVTVAKELVEAMDVRVVADGSAPGVRIRINGVGNLAVLAVRVTDLASCYQLNGVLPDQLPEPRLSWNEAVGLARRELSLDPSEWLEVTNDDVYAESYTELRKGYDYYQIRFNPTNSYSGDKTGVVAFVDRQSGRLLRREWLLPYQAGGMEPTEDQLREWALQAAEQLPGPKQVSEVHLAEGEHPWAVVVAQSGKTPIYTDYLFVRFHADTGEVLDWLNYQWGEQLPNFKPSISEATALARLRQQVAFEAGELDSVGTAVVRSQFTDQVTLTYRFSLLTEVDGSPTVIEYFINAHTGKLERIGKGW